MSKQNIIVTIIVALVLFINVFVAYSVTIPNLTIIATLPNKVKESRLLRIVDKEAGVVCYILQNDTADFYSGLQCIRLGPFFTNELLQQEQQTNEDNREERNSKMGR